jgi:hypothetical protein
MCHQHQGAEVGNEEYLEGFPQTFPTTVLILPQYHDPNKSFAHFLVNVGLLKNE